MPDAFENILGQPQVREYLRSTVAQDLVSHAYLFTGPAGSSKTLAAYAFARAILCTKSPEGSLCASGKNVSHSHNSELCDACNRVMRRTHPDVHYIMPEGAGGYLVEQIRGLVSDSALAPIQGRYKVYILDRVDLLGVQAANAFLKTLEEPCANVVIILLARTRESVLPTVLSRCQVVPFRSIPAREAAGIIVQNSGASEEKARVALEACGGSITRAIGFLKSNERLDFRGRVLEILGCLRRSDDWDIIGFASELVVLSKAPLDVVKVQQEQDLADNADFLAKSVLRRIEEQNKRQITAKTYESLHQLTALVCSWLRDVAVLCAETPQLVINVDAQASLLDAARYTNEAHAIAALKAVRLSDEAISYNVSPETCIDAMLFEIRDILYSSASLRENA